MDVKGEHEFKETITVDIFYPDHAPRVASALYRHTHHQLIHVQNRKCWICGTSDRREVHHFHIEWADANMVDWEKVKEEHPNFDWSTFKSAEDFIDSEYNMMVLCMEHHRGKDRGIHMLPYPIWIGQKYKKEGFIFAPEQS